MADENTPPAVLVTPAEKAIAMGALRSLIKAVVPHLPALAKYAATALVPLLLSSAHTWSEKAETDKKVAAAEAATKRGYKVLAKPAREISGELSAATKRIDALEATQVAQSALIAACERDFVVRGKPAKAAQRRVAAGLVKVVKENAAANARELAARKAKPAPAITPIPLELPPPPPQGAKASPAPPANTPSTPSAAGGSS